MNCSRSFQVLLALLFTTPLARTQEGGGESKQRPRFPRRGFAGREIDKTLLLRSDQVKEELKVTEEQDTKISDVLSAHLERSRQEVSFRGVRELPREERRERIAEVRKKRRALVKETEKKLEALLTQDQVRRLDEILLQQRGARGLLEKATARTLELTSEQTEKLRAVFAWAREARAKLLREVRGQGREAVEKTEEKISEIRKEMDGKALAVLTAEQKHKYEKLKGKPFELDRSSLGGWGGAGSAEEGEGDKRGSDGQEGPDER